MIADANASASIALIVASAAIVRACTLVELADGSEGGGEGGKDGGAASERARAREPVPAAERRAMALTLLESVAAAAAAYGDESALLVYALDALCLQPEGRETRRA